MLLWRSIPLQENFFFFKLVQYFFLLEVNYVVSQLNSREEKLEFHRKIQNQSRLKNVTHSLFGEFKVYFFTNVYINKWNQSSGPLLDFISFNGSFQFFSFIWNTLSKHLELKVILYIICKYIYISLNFFFGAMLSVL